MESSGAPEDDKPPPRPEGVHSAEKEDPTYSEMMATLADHVKVDVEKVNPSDPFDAYVAEVKKHKAKVEDLQQQLLVKLADLEKEEARKITSESIHTGFDNSYISKSDKQTVQASAPPSTKGKEKTTSVEVLNPQVLETDALPPQAEDGDELAGKDEDEHIEPSELGKKFSLIKMSNYSALLQFVLNNPNVLAERETDGLLILAFNSQLEGKDDFARQCVHQALIIQYCRTLGHGGASLFFNRITTKGHQAQKLFLDDVIDTHNRIRMRAKEVNTARDNGTGGGDSEQIQLHAVDPGTSINISIPDKDSPDEAEQKSRTIFNSFPPNLQRALESGKLDEVNKVLGKMKVDEAEKIVGLLGEVSFPIFHLS
jgi:cell division cycle protein 37